VKDLGSETDKSDAPGVIAESYMIVAGVKALTRRRGHYDPSDDIDIKLLFKEDDTQIASHRLPGEP